MVASRSESKETHYQDNLKITSHTVEDSHCGPLKSTTFLSRLAFTSKKSFKESNITALDVVTSHTAIVTCHKSVLFAICLIHSETNLFLNGDLCL